MNAYDTYYSTLAELDQHGAANESQRRRAFAALLISTGKEAKWTLVEEVPLPGRRRKPDATLYDRNHFPCGYWEAKDPADDLEAEIRAKIGVGYPLKNTIFEDSRKGVLFQNQTRVFDADLTRKSELKALLDRFFDHREQEREEFDAAVKKFQEDIPELARGLANLVDREQTENPSFHTAFDAFHEVCRGALNPKITEVEIEEMLVQHLLTERIFRTVFNNPDFTRRNVIAREIETVISALTGRSFSREEYLQRLDFFYNAIERTARCIADFSEKQGFLNRVYERFFQGFSVAQADTHGIVYTPQPIVDFMCASVDHVLREQFGLSLSSPGVRILDPCTGTGNFIVNILNRIDPQDLPRKYRHELFANEIMLLPYYIAALNIEHAYYERTGSYEPFEGICFADTLDMGTEMQTALFTEANTERVQREKDAEITVVIGNPPYNMGQQNENDNNKNRRYARRLPGDDPCVDDCIRETYVKESRATLSTKVYDAYVRFFRWATDRLGDRDGVVCFVSNNSFLDQIAFDGMRKSLESDFTSIYHLNCRGNVRKNPKISGTTHNVFGIQVGVGLTVLVRRRHADGTRAPCRIRYYSQDDFARASEKLGELAGFGDVGAVGWTDLCPDARNNWITEGLRAEYRHLLPLGSKVGKAESRASIEPEVIFKLYSLGLATNRDEWIYDYQLDVLHQKVARLVSNYNQEVYRFREEHPPQEDIDKWVNNDAAYMKWTDRLKSWLSHERTLAVEDHRFRRALYRPYVAQSVYFDDLLNQRRYQLHHAFPTPGSEQENIAICLAHMSGSKPFHCLAGARIPDLHLTGDTQCFPYYVYDEDGTNRRENVTDWALARFREAYGPDVTKRDIFHYVYSLLHHPVYRERYAENLKKELPRIPVTGDQGPVTGDGFRAFVEIGAALMEQHLGYEAAPEYDLKWRWKPGVPISWHVEKMRLTPEKDAVVVNPCLTLEGVPAGAFDYRLGNRSALEWVIDQYQVKTDKRSGIVSDPNRPDDPEYIARLVGRVITVSVETVRLVRRLSAEYPWPDDG